MEPFAILGLQMINHEARSALPDAPVVDDRPSMFGRVLGRIAAARRGTAGRGLGDPVRVPTRRDVRRAA